MPEQEKSKFDEARNMLIADQDYLQADSTGKAKMLDSFFDSMGTPYLKTKGIIDQKLVSDYKTAFIKEMTKEESSKKKKASPSLFGDGQTLDERFPEAIVPEGSPKPKKDLPVPELKKKGTSYSESVNDSREQAGIESDRQTANQFRLLTDLEQESLDAQTDFEKGMGRAMRDPSKTLEDAENRSWLDQQEDIDASWREPGSKPKLPAKYDYTPSPAVQSLKSNIERIKKLDSGTSQEWLERSLNYTYGQEQTEVDALREQTVEHGTAYYEQEQERVGQITKSLLEKQQELSAMLKQLSVVQNEGADDEGESL